MCASSSMRCAATRSTPFQSGWLMMSDVCKHCHNAPCVEACPTGALFRTEFDTVVVQQDICNGCGYCVPACPFGVVDISPLDGKAHKCTLCYDRLKGGLEPACAKACPTDSIQFGEIDRAAGARAGSGSRRCTGRRGDRPISMARPDAPGATGGLGHLNAFFLLTDRAGDLQSAARAHAAGEPRGAEPGCGTGRDGLACAGGAGDVRRARLRRRADAEMPTSAGDRESWDGRTYYGRPQLKPAPFNNWLVGSYVFLAGLSGGAQLLSTVLDLRAAATAAADGTARPVSVAAGADVGQRVPDLRPAHAAAVLQHAADVQGDVADVDRQLDPGGVRRFSAHRRRAFCRTGPGFRLAALAGAGRRGCRRRSRERGWAPTRRRCCRPPARRLGGGPGATGGAVRRSRSPPRRRPCGLASAACVWVAT